MLMQIIDKRGTRWEGQRLECDDILEVDFPTAKSWVRHSIGMPAPPGSVPTARTPDAARLKAEQSEALGRIEEAEEEAKKAEAADAAALPAGVQEPPADPDEVSAAAALEAMTVPELREAAKTKGATGMSNASKADLVAFLLEHGEE